MYRSEAHGRAVEPDDDVARAILEMGRLAASRLNPSNFERFKQDLNDRVHQRGNHAYYRHWKHIVDSGIAAVANVLREDSERATYLRSVISLASLVSQSERDEIFRRVLRRERTHERLRA